MALRFGPMQLLDTSAYPRELWPFVRAAELGEDLIPAIMSVAHRFGFDSFTYWAATRSTPVVEGRLYELTTLPEGWPLRYDERAYVESDPRVDMGLHQTLPFAWDGGIWRGRTAGVDSFLDDAATFGVGNGVCVPIHEPSFGVARIDFDSARSTVDASRRGAIAEALGPLSVFARVVHNVISIAAIRNELPTRNYGSPLSPRELECLASTMRGLDVECALGLTKGIAKLHFDSIRSKIGCLKCDEAVAYVLKRRLLPP